MKVDVSKVCLKHQFQVFCHMSLAFLRYDSIIFYRSSIRENSDLILYLYNMSKPSSHLSV